MRAWRRATKYFASCRCCPAVLQAGYKLVKAMLPPFEAAHMTTACRLVCFHPRGDNIMLQEPCSKQGLRSAALLASARVGTSTRSVMQLIIKKLKPSMLRAYQWSKMSSSSLGSWNASDTLSPRPAARKAQILAAPGTSTQWSHVAVAGHPVQRHLGLAPSTAPSTPSPQPTLGATAAPSEAPWPAWPSLPRPSMWWSKCLMSSPSQTLFLVCMAA